MADANTDPYIAVVGGFYALDDSKKSDAISIAESLGAALAKAKFNLVVYLADEDSLEPHVVRGYVRHAQDRKQCIRIQTPLTLRPRATFEEEKSHGAMFNPDLFPSEDWEAPFYQSLAKENGADAIVLLSGGGSTLIAGHIALARELPVLAIQEMGGSAYEIWKQLKLTDPSTQSWTTGRSNQLVADLRAKCDQARNVRKDHESEIRKIESWSSSKRYAMFCGAAFLAFVAALIYAIIGAPSPNEFFVATIIGLLTAGATGALARGVIWATTRNDAGITLLLGALAGLVVGLGYIIPQLVGSAGIFDPNQTVVTTADIIQFLSALLVSISAGVGFDTVFDRLRTQAESLPISGDST